MSVRRTVSSGNCPSGNYPLGGGGVLSGKCPSGKKPLEKCPSSHCLDTLRGLFRTLTNIVKELRAKAKKLHLRCLTGVCIRLGVCIFRFSVRIRECNTEMKYRLIEIFDARSFVGLHLLFHNVFILHIGISTTILPP